MATNIFLFGGFWFWNLIYLLPTKKVHGCISFVFFILAFTVSGVSLFFFFLFFLAMGAIGDNAQKQQRREQFWHANQNQRLMWKKNYMDAYIYSVVKTICIVLKYFIYLSLSSCIYHTWSCLFFGLDFCLTWFRIFLFVLFCALWTRIMPIIIIKYKAVD